MTPPYLLAALALALSDPLALLAETLVMLCYLHLAGAGGYLIFRMMGGGWDALDAGCRVLRAVKRVRESVAGAFARREWVEYVEVMEL